MASTQQEKFQDFVKKIGLRSETAEKLWTGNVKTPQELAASDQETLRTLVNDPLLINAIFPVLQKYVFPITMAQDPYTHAIDLLQREAGQSHSAPSIQSDSIPFNTTSGQTNAVHNNARSELPTTHMDGGFPLRNSTTSNTASSVASQNHQAVTTEHSVSPAGIYGVAHHQPTQHHHGTSATISITGGSFLQSSIMPTREVVYNNTGTTLNAAAWNNSEKKQQPLTIPGDFFADRKDFCWENVKVPPVDQTVFRKHVNDNSIYKNDKWGQSRALIINNVSFQHCSGRLGAENDGKNLQNLLEQLGFTVENHQDKTKVEMEQLLREFTSDSRNGNAPMTLVYIGTHGQRDGNVDYFIGVDDGRVAVEDLSKYFSRDACPLLHEKPKIFFLQFCRKDRQQTTASDSMETNQGEQLGWNWLDSVQSDADSFNDHVKRPGGHDLADMIFSFATSPGTKAYRDTSIGSWYVTTLAKVFQPNAKDEDLASMLTKVNNIVMDKMGQEQVNDTRETAVQMTETRTYLRKKVMFFPGASGSKTH